jgi:hypothetical protein
MRLGRKLATPHRSFKKYYATNSARIVSRCFLLTSPGGNPQLTPDIPHLESGEMRDIAQPHGFDQKSVSRLAAKSTYPAKTFSKYIVGPIGSRVDCRYMAGSDSPG